MVERLKISTVPAHEQRPQIGWDFDNVLQRLQHRAWPIIKERHNLPGTRDDVPTERLQDTHKQLERSDILEVFAILYNDPFLLPPAHINLPNMLRRLSDDLGVDHHLVTRTPATTPQLMTWLEVHGVFSHFEEITKVSSAEEKAEVARVITIVEDDPAVAELFASSRRPAMLIKTPWNTDAVTQAEADPKSLVYPVVNLRQAEDILLSELRR